MANEIYEGPIKVYTTNSRGEPLLTKSGKPYKTISFQANGSWINLADFQGYVDGINDGDECEVIYYQKFNDRGEPELYNNKPKYQLEYVRLLNEAPAQQEQQQEQQPTPAPKPTTQGTYREAISAMQTSLKAAVDLTVAEITTGSIAPASVDLMSIVLNRAERFHAHFLAGTFGGFGDDEDIPF